MKVGLISAHPFSEEGGVKTHILNLKREFQKKNVKTKVLVPRAKIFEKYDKDTILLGTALRIEFGGGISDLIFSFLPLAIERVLLREKFDVLHFHNFTLPATLQILLSPLSFSSTTILTFHSNIERSAFLKKYPFFIDLLNDFCNLRIHGVILVSKILRPFFQNYKGEIEVIPNGVSLEAFGPTVPPVKKFLDKKLNLLFVGRLEERKGPIYLLKAFRLLKKKYPQARLIFVGDGPQRSECESFVKKFNLKDVVFEGWVAQEKVPSYYASCDIFCVPSIYGESFGIILLEALASQKPVVAFNIEAFLEVVKEGKGVLFAKNKNIFDLAKKIEFLILHKEKRKELGFEGRKWVQKYSWEKVAQKVLDFYQKIKNQREKKSLFIKNEKF